MQAIQAIVDAYVRLRNEAALLALKQQRLKVLASCDPNDPLFARLRSQCLEEISEIGAGLEQLRPPPVVVPAAAPSPPGANALPPPVAAGPRPTPPAVDALPAPAAADPPARPTPIDPSPFLAVEDRSPPILNAPAPVPAAGGPAAIMEPTAPPQPFAAPPVAPSLLASTLLAASLSAKLAANGEKLEPELMRLQIALQERMRSST